MNIGSVFDCSIVAFLILHTYLGWRRGLLWQAAGVASMAFGVGLGWFLAPALSGILLEHVTRDPFRAKLIVFLFILGLIGFMLRMLAAWAEVKSEQGLPKAERDLRRADDRILGGIFGALKGCVITLVLVAACVSLWPRHEIWRKSRLALPWASAGARLLPEGAVNDVRHWAGDSAKDLRQGLEIRTSSGSATLTE